MKRMMSARCYLVGIMMLASIAGRSQETPKDRKSAPPKNIDVIVMKNGDRLSGEIKRIEHGLLYIETPYISGEQVAVDWLQVERLESLRDYRVELANGSRLVGEMRVIPAKDSDQPAVSIHGEDRETHLVREDVIGMGWQKRNFFRQLKGDIDFGYNYTSGNDQVQGNLIATSRFDSTKYRMEGELSSSISLVSGANETNRHELGLLFGRYLSRRDMVFGAADFLTSSQQKLNLRSFLGAGYGRGFIKTPRTELNVRMALALNHESYAPSAGIQPFHNSVESVFSVVYSTFQLNRSEFNAKLSLMPSLSDAGRVRSNINSAYRMKLVNNFYAQLGLWDTYDSRPPINSKKNELGVSTGLGWSY